MLKKERNLKSAGAIFILFCGILRFYAATHRESHIVELLKAKQYDQVISESNTKIQANPKDIFALTNRGFAYLQKREFDQAIKDYDQALTYNPKFVYALNGRCLVRAAMNDFDAAIRDCTLAINSDSSVGGTFFSRGIGYAGENQFDLALHDINEAIRLMPDKEALYSFRGVLYVNLGKLEEARKDFDKSRALGGGDPALIVGQGMLDFLSDSYGDAVIDLEKGLKKGSAYSYAIIWLHLAKMHSGQDDREELKRLNAGLNKEKWPSSVAALYAGDATPDDVNAQAATGSSALHDEQACEAKYYIGEYYLQKGDRDNAKMALQSAVDSCQKYPSTERQAAAIELKTQKF